MRARSRASTIAPTMIDANASAISASDGYALDRTPQEYARLRRQALVWESATGRLFDQVGLAPGMRCLDAGCGPGETMRLMAQRVGPSGHVTGVDIDAPLGVHALAMLHDAGHRQCEFARLDLTTGAPIPGAPFDLVYARLLLHRLPEPVSVLRRLWATVAPGGHLLVQDYDLRGCGALPALASLDEWARVVSGAFSAAGFDVAAGTRLPLLFEEAGIGAPEVTDVAGRLEPLVTAQHAFAAVLGSVLPTAIAQGVTGERRAAASLAAIAGDAARFPQRPALWPLLIGACKRKPQDQGGPRATEDA